MTQIKGKHIEDLAISKARLGADAVDQSKIEDAAVQSEHLHSGAKQSVLESKLLALRVGILTFSPANAASEDISTEVLAAATTDTPVGAGESVSAQDEKGIFVGTVSGANDVGRVIVRDAGTDNGISDDEQDEVYGVLSEATGVYTITWKQADGGAFTMAGTESLDLYFVEVFDMYAMGVDRMLMGAVNGVVDADTAGDLLAHKQDASGAHAASAISDDAQTNYMTGTDVAAQLGQADTQLKTNADAIGLNTTHRGSNGSDHSYVGNLQTLSGESAGSTAHGAFTGDTIPDSQTTKQALQALETAVEANAGSAKHEILTLDGTDITNKYKDLTDIPADVNKVLVIPVGGTAQLYTDDYTIITNGSVIKRLNWDGLGMESLLAAADKIQVIFES